MASEKHARTQVNSAIKEARLHLEFGDTDAADVLIEEWIELMDELADELREAQVEVMAAQIAEAAEGRELVCN